MALEDNRAGHWSKRLRDLRPLIGTPARLTFVFAAGTYIRAFNRHTMAQDSDARLRAKRKATVKLARLKAAAEAKGEKPKGKRVVKKKA